MQQHATVTLAGIHKQGEGGSRTQEESRRKHLHPPRSDHHLIKISDGEEEEKDNMEDSQVWNTVIHKVTSGLNYQLCACARQQSRY